MNCGAIRLSQPGSAAGQGLLFIDASMWAIAFLMRISAITF
jgi:hypothetical protein